MFRRSVLMLVVLIVSAIPTGLAAQYGHPMKGQWSGEWRVKDQPRRILIDLQWDGKSLAGTVNPGGAEAATVRNVVLDYSNPAAWKVSFEAEKRDAAGKAIRIAASGTLENIGAYRRVLHGTWVEGTEKGEFVVTRN